MAGYGSYRVDPIILAAQARAVLEKLHKQHNIVVRFKTDESGFDEDAVDEHDRENPGHFGAEKNILTLNLDSLIPADKAKPTSLASVEDFRQFPVLAGVAAHESGHARWSLWGELPDSIPNPDFDPFNPTRTVEHTDEEGNTTTSEEPVPESYPVSETGKLFDIAQALEEPRIERLGVSTYTKTWRKAMQYSAGHMILEQIEEMDAEDERPLESAVKMAIYVGGRYTAGTLGATYESRKAVKKVLSSAQAIIEKALENREDVPEDPYHVIMGLVNKQVFNNDHEDATSHLEAARQILKIIHPEEQDDPDKPDRPDENEEEGDKGEGGAGGLPGHGESALDSEALKDLLDKMHEAIDGMAEELGKMTESEQENPDELGGGGHGSTLFKNPNAPQIDHYEQPNSADRELYRRAVSWMEKQVEPTVTESEVGQWLPVGGARLNVRSMVRDNLAGHRASQRTDWDRVSETVKPAPPVKVAIMLDGSGSMSRMARPSASIAWAAANAAAQLPESRTVSVVYGDAAQVTQVPGHVPAKQIAVSRTNGGTEEFIGAAKMVEDALWLDEPVEEGEPSNVLIIIISDLHYGGAHRAPNGKVEGQFAGFMRITKEWADKGFQIVVVGADMARLPTVARDYGDLKDPNFSAFTIKKPEELFR